MLTRFQTRKQKILEQLAAPDEEYHDLSPKGSVDAPIRGLIADINNLAGLVTTSSCSGRVSVFLEGRRAGANETTTEETSSAGPGGKGGGGAWLYISHDPVIEDQQRATDYMALFGLQKSGSNHAINCLQIPSCRYIHFKFEPMILHILSATLDDCQRITTAALSAGFRESGAVSLTPSKNGEVNPMVAVRSTGYSFDAIIGYHDENGNNIALVGEQYLRILTNIANERFQINTERIERFRTALLEQYCPQAQDNDSSSLPGWEDAESRKYRKREEGLARQQAMKAQNKSEFDTETDAPIDDDLRRIFKKFSTASSN